MQWRIAIRHCGVENAEVYTYTITAFPFIPD
jgi:hypothetical protein